MAPRHTARPLAASALLCSLSLASLWLCPALVAAQTNQGLEVGETHPEGLTEETVAGAIWDYVQVRSNTLPSRSASPRPPRRHGALPAAAAARGCPLPE